MPDTFTPNLNLCKPAAGSIDWDTKINGNFDLIDPLESRVAALEALHGGEVPGFWVMAPGSTWADFLTTYTSAGSGDTIMLPNETIIQTSAKQIDKSITILGHPGGLSNLKAVSDLSLSGSGQQLFIYTGALPALKVRLSGFTIEHDRSTVTRISAVNYGGYIDYLDISFMTFKNITSDVSHHYSNPDPSGVAQTKNVNFRYNAVQEWYESVMLTYAGSIDGLYVIGNNCVTTAPHPNTAVSRPYGVDIGLEYDTSTSNTIVSNVIIAGNTFDASGAPGASMANSLGIALSQSGTTGGISYRNVVAQNNIIKGFYYNMRLVNMNNIGGPIGSHIYFMDNKLSSGLSHNIHIQPFDGGGTPGYGSPNDLVVVTGNDVTASETDVFEDFSNASALTYFKSKNNYHT